MHSSQRSLFFLDLEESRQIPPPWGMAARPELSGTEEAQDGCWALSMQ